MIDIHFPPYTVLAERGMCKIFLAGTIDNGSSFDWQNELCKFINEHFDKSHRIHIFNPRRKDWNSEWSKNQDHPQLRRQIEWELCYLEKANVIPMVFLKDSKSPISLLELGAFKDKNILVYCPKEFYRRANIEVFCRENKIEVIEDWDLFKITLKRSIAASVIHKALTP